ncbi:Box C/D snoRNA protein 1 [Bagarius yarrelli]|uniref:Box C/D snoRNA protein 1 n=1 Tax=Bagarius yarrelli TaxID=175774 RepID=A0A556VBK9_BAGYA|nr:Box C/D snoRNA protein 1 [Bagarius yarrelli]
MFESTSFLEKKISMDASEEEPRGQKRKISLTSCDVCEAEEAKYRCPNCLKCSCRVPEDRVLEKILSHYIHPSESDPVKRQSLKTYAATPLHQLGVFLKAEQGLPNALKFHELDVKKSLRENLMFKTVVEYPELHVVVGKHCDKYHSRIPDKSITLPHLSTSSEARVVPERLVHTSRPDTETTAPSELEEGEISSEDEENTGKKEEDLNSTGNSAVSQDRNDDVGGR